MEATKNSPLDWFEHLASGIGRSCSDADGHIVEEADWEPKNGHYRVLVPKATQFQLGEGHRLRSGTRGELNFCAKRQPC